MFNQSRKRRTNWDFVESFTILKRRVGWEKAELGWDLLWKRATS